MEMGASPGCRLFTRALRPNLSCMSTDANTRERLAERVTELEVLFTHLGRSVADLDKVILDQQKQIDGLRGELARFMMTLEHLTEMTVETRDERPPHY